MKLVAVRGRGGVCRHCQLSTYRHRVDGACLQESVPNTPREPLTFFDSGQLMHVFVDVDDHNAVIGGRIESYLPRDSQSGTGKR